MEQLDYDLLCRWFVGLNMDDAIWDVSVFTNNRQRLLGGEVATAFPDAIFSPLRIRADVVIDHSPSTATHLFTGTTANPLFGPVFP